MRWAVVFLIVVGLATLAHAGVRKDFQSLWGARLAGYAKTHADLQGQTEGKQAKATQLIAARHSEFSPEGHAALGAIKNQFRLQGRQSMLAAFLVHLQKRPPFEGTLMYLSSARQMVAEEQAAAEMQWKIVDDRVSKNPSISNEDWFSLYSDAIKLRATADGRADELAMLIDNMRAYEAALNREDDNQRRSAEAWSRLGQSMTNYSQQPSRDSKITDCTPNFGRPGMTCEER